MNHVPIIGITGKKFSGKTTFARAVVDEMKRTYSLFGARYFYAQPLKEICHKLFGGTEDNWYGDFKNQRMEKWAKKLGEHYSSPRKIMQLIGTELFRNNLHNEFWLFVAEEYIEAIIVNEAPDFIIIDDVRFDNEAAFILSRHPANRVVHVTRNLPCDGDSHASERGVAQELITDKIDNSQVGAFVPNPNAVSLCNTIVAAWKKRGVIA